MDTLFITLLLMSGLCAVLGVLAAIELFWTRIAESNWWREMPPRTIPYECISILGIIVPGAFTGLVIFCVHATLGWWGLAAAAALFITNLWCVRYIQRNEPDPPPMATRVLD